MKKNKKKVNPRRRPATYADVKKAAQVSQSLTTKVILVIILSVLHDKEGFGKKRLKRVWDAVNERSDAIAQGYASIDDYAQMLRDEVQIHVL